ncbi:MAG: hypothetical protein ABSA49_04325 [Rhizomicrobium sp.]
MAALSRYVAEHVCRDDQAAVPLYEINGAFELMNKARAPESWWLIDAP